MAGFLPPVIMEIQANATEAIASLKSVNTELSSMEARATAAGTSLTGMEKASKVASVALNALSIAAVGIGVLAVKAAVDSEAAFARLDTALKNSGNGSKTTQEQMQKLSETNTKLGFSTVATAGALGTLVTATGSTKDATKLLSTAMDLARYKHISLEEASTILARGTQGSAKAFKEMGITLDTHLPKQQAINKAMDELNQRLSGQNAAYLKTFGGQMASLGAQAQLVAEKIGNVLIPIIQDILGFIQRFGKELLILGGAIIATVAAFKIYETTMALFKAAQIVYIAFTSGMTAAQTALTFATEGGAAATKSMTAVQWALNAAMEANPIGLIIAGVAILVAALVVLWNHCEPVRKIMIDVGKFGVEAFGFIIKMVGIAATSILKLVTGPMRTMLSLFSHLPGVGKYAKEALDFINTGINDVGSFFDSASKKVDGFASSLDSLNKKSSAPKKAADSAGDTSGYDLTNYTGATKAAKSVKDKISPVVDSINAELTKATTTYQTAINNANKNYNDAKLAADKEFNDKQTQLLDDWRTKQGELMVTHADNLLKINADYASKLKAVVQKSIDELTNAFANATKTDVGGIFSDLQKAGDTSGSALVSSMKDKLEQIKKLATDASTLAGKGFNQAFIQQVIAQGPVVGDQLTQSILSSTPDQIAQMQSLFSQLTDESNNGVTALATSMSQPGQLATQALNEEYKAMQVQMNAAIADENNTYTKAFLDAQAIFNKANAENLAKQQDAYNKANDALLAATSKAEGAYTVSLDKIQTTFDTKLGNVQTTVQATIDKITALNDAISGAKSTVISSAVVGGGGSNSIFSSGYVSAGNSSTMVGGTVINNYNIPVSTNVAMSPSDLQSSVTNGVKYGTPLTVSKQTMGIK
jgi:predicted nucleic acid-binding protein